MYQTKCFWNVINKYMYMPFNITSHTNVQFDLEKQSHSMLSMHYRSLYHLCLFSHCGVRKPVTTLALYVCALNAHYFNTDALKSTVFSGQVFDSRTHFELQKNTTRNKNLSVQLGRNPFFCSHLLCLIWRFSCTIRSHKDWHTHHIMTLTSNRGYVHYFNLLAFLATTFSNDWEIMNVWISISAIKSDFPRFNFSGFTAVLSAWSFTSSEFNPGPGRTFCNWMSIPASENFLLACRHCKTKICEMYNK